jgi:hypothetical protein
MLDRGKHQSGYGVHALACRRGKAVRRDKLKVFAHCQELHTRRSSRCFAVTAVKVTPSKNRACKCLILNAQKRGQTWSRPVKPKIFVRWCTAKIAGWDLNKVGNMWHPAVDYLNLNSTGASYCQLLSPIFTFGQLSAEKKIASRRNSWRGSGRPDQIGHLMDDYHPYRRTDGPRCLPRILRFEVFALNLE